MKKSYTAPKVEKLNFNYIDQVTASNTGNNNTQITKTLNGNGRGNNKTWSNGCCVF